MPEITIRCTHCREASTVDRDEIGQDVECPNCGQDFEAFPEVKVVRQAIIPIVPVVKAKPAVSIEEVHIEPSSAVPFLVGLAILPLAIPIVWVILLSTGKFEPLFTMGIPISIGVAAAGLGIGAAITKDWSTSRKLKSILAISLLAISSSVALFVLKKEWGEAIRKRLSADDINWQDYITPTFRVKVPPNLKKEKDQESLLPQWELYAVKFGNPRRGAGDSYRIAHGPEPDAQSNLPDKEWFETTVKQLTTEDTGPPKSTQSLRLRDQYEGIEVVFQKADGATNLTVRVYRVGSAVIMLAVEGALLPADARDVQNFFKSLYIEKLK